MSIDNWLSVVAVLVALMSLLLSAVVAVKSWHKSRVVHGLEEFVLRKINGGRGDSDRGLKEINEKLKTGKYTMQGIQDRVDGDWAVLLARVKK